jgi:hypothetical protein
VTFHDDVYALAQHARTSTNPHIRQAAQRLLTGLMCSSHGRQAARKGEAKRAEEKP